MVIMCGIDASDKSLVCAIGAGKEEPAIRTYANTVAKRQKLYEDLKGLQSERNAEMIITAYEACGLGFVMHDEMEELGIDCRVLSPGQMKRGIREKKLKTDASDAAGIFMDLRGYVLAGNKLPEVWVKPKSIREDLEAARHRVDLGADIGRKKTQVLAVLKKHGIVVREKELIWGTTGSEHADFTAIAESVRIVLEGHLREIEMLTEEKKRYDCYLAVLARKAEYKPLIDSLMKIRGVGVLTAMCFILELGDMSRFRNRRKLGSYLGLIPMSYESGEASDRKGHITRTGPSRLRKLLNQAAWVWIGGDNCGNGLFARIVERNPKKKKIAIVGCMRRLSIVMWQTALVAQRGMQESGEKVA